VRGGNARGASLFEYSALLALVIGVGLVGAGALGASTAETVRSRSECVRTLDCRRAPGASSVPSPQEEPPGPNTAWDGVAAEVGTSASEMGRAVVSPGDVLRGASLAIDHPRAALRAAMTHEIDRAPKERAPRHQATSNGSEELGRDVVRIVTMLGVFAIGRLATMGARAGGSGSIDWDLPPPPALPEDPVATLGGSR
jgi:hypothetical protein